MNAIKPVAQTTDTITLKRRDFDALVRAAEDAGDLAAVEAHRAYEDRVGWETARRNYLSSDEARRLLDGESPVRVWREKRRIKQRTLAEAAEVAVSYLAEIEGGKKPGSAGALARIAGVLEMPLGLLAGGMETPQGLQPVSRAESAMQRLVRLVEAGADSDRTAEEAREITGEWDKLAQQRGLAHQVRAAIEVLADRVIKAKQQRDERATTLERDGEESAATRQRKMDRAYGRAYDALVDHYNALVDQRYAR